jgi:hypothetical protein
VTTPTLTSRPRVDLSGGDLYRKADEAWTALVEANDEAKPRVLVRGNELVRMTERGELEAYGPDSLRDELSRAAAFGWLADDGWVAKDPPQDLARVLLARDSGEYGGAPRVDRVVDTPVLARDGSLITTPGYHADSKLFYRPAAELESVRPADVELVEDVAGARDLLLNDLLGDFGWADEASKANALGLLLLPFVREFIGDDPTPMHLILAPEPGTGKTLLAQTTLLPGCGLVPVTAGDRDHNDEWRKSLTASLLRGTRAIIFDNLRGGLESGPLAAALTSGMWRDRVLGYSCEVSLPIRNAWVATGNNLMVSDEQARRAVPIFLDPGDIRPAERSKDAFRHANLLRWAQEQRAALVRAALTLVRHWVEGTAVTTHGGHVFVRDSSTYASSQRTLGSFERWADVIGGILAAADVPDFLGNRDRLNAEANEEMRELADFLAAWDALEVEPLEVAQVRDLCRFGGALRDSLPVDLSSMRDDRLEARLPYWLRERRNQRVGGYQLLALDGRPRRWYIRHTGRGLQ